MCGIFGYQFRPNFRPNLEKRTLLAAALGRENDKRGDHSWGYFDSGSGIIEHGMGSIIGKARGLSMGFSVIGHTRYATVGDKIIANAHPFAFGSVVGAHNGGISNHGQLNTTRIASGLERFDCDSMHLIDAISRGLDKTKDLMGWGACHWVDLKDTRMVRMAKLSGGADLAVCQTQNGMVWSSDEKHLAAALLEAGMSGVYLKIEENKVYNIRSGCLTISEDKIQLGSMVQVTGYHGGTYGSRWVDKREDIDDMGDPPQGVMGFISEKMRKRWQKFDKKRKQDMADAATKSAATGVIIDKDLDYRVCEDCYTTLDKHGACPNGHGKASLVIVPAV